VGQLVAVELSTARDAVECQRTPRRDDEHVPETAVVRVARLSHVVVRRLVAVAKLIGEAGEEFRRLVAVPSADEAVVTWLVGEDDAQGAARIDLADDDVRVVLGVEVGADATQAGAVVDICVNRHPRSFAIGDRLCDRGIACRGAERLRLIELRGSAGLGGVPRGARASEHHDAERRADQTAPHTPLPPRSVVYTIKHTPFHAQEPAGASPPPTSRSTTRPALRNFTPLLGYALGPPTLRRRPAD